MSFALDFNPISAPDLLKRLTDAHAPLERIEQVRTLLDAYQAQHPHLSPLHRFTAQDLAAAGILP